MTWDSTAVAVTIIITPGAQKMEVSIPNRGTEKDFVYEEGIDGTLKKTEENPMKRLVQMCRQG